MGQSFFFNAPTECQAEACLRALCWPESHSDHFYTYPAWAEAKYDFAALNGAFSVVTSTQQTVTLWSTLRLVPSFILHTHVLSICQLCQSVTLFSSNYTGISNKSVQLSSMMVIFFSISFKGTLYCSLLLQNWVWIFHLSCSKLALVFDGSLKALFLRGLPRISMITQKGLWKVFIKTRAEDKFPWPQRKT